MNRIISGIMCLLAVANIYAQTGRVGVNTANPKATLDVMQNNNNAEDYPQGVIFPRISSEKRAQFSEVEVGTMIYNTTRKCLETYKGQNTGGDNGWHCCCEDTAITEIDVRPDFQYVEFLIQKDYENDNKCFLELPSFTGIRDIYDVINNGLGIILARSRYPEVLTKENLSVKAAYNVYDKDGRLLRSQTIDPRGVIQDMRLSYEDTMYREYTIVYNRLGFDTQQFDHKTQVVKLNVQITLPDGQQVFSKDYDVKYKGNVINNPDYYTCEW